MLGCVPFYGADFSYPDDLPVATMATAVLSDEGWDDDDPIRTRLQVVDVGDANGAVLTDFYRQSFRPSEGWIEQEPGTGSGANQSLCLVNNSSERYTEVVEVFAYTGGRVDVRKGRYLVMITRVQDDEGHPCGVAFPWIAMDLY